MELSTKMIGAIAASLSLLAAPAVYAKNHDSGVSTEAPATGGRDGVPPGETTSAGAQTLGGPTMGDTISDAARADDEPGFSDGKGTFGDSEPGAR